MLYFFASTFSKSLYILVFFFLAFLIKCLAFSKRYAKWKTPDTKDHTLYILYDLIYMKCLEMLILYRKKVDLWLLRSGRGHRSDYKRAWGLFLGMKFLLWVTKTISN